MSPRRTRRLSARSGSPNDIGDEGRVVAEPGAPPVVRVGAGQRPQPVDQDMVEPPAPAIAGEGPARLALVVPMQGAEGIDPPVPAKIVDEGPLGPVPALAALGTQPAR